MLIRGMEVLGLGLVTITEIEDKPGEWQWWSLNGPNKDYVAGWVPCDSKENEYINAQSVR